MAGDRIYKSLGQISLIEDANLELDFLKLQKIPWWSSG